VIVTGLRRGLRGVRRGGQLLGSARRICYLRLAYGTVSVGFDCHLGPGCDIVAGPGARLILRRVVVGRGCTIIAGAGATIDIAARSIGPYSVIVARQRITIGEGSLLAEMTVVRDANHDRRPGGALTENRHRCAPVSIGREVWLGARATVLSGVTIADRATVAAGAVVTHDVAADIVVAGVPARPLPTGAG
jgi:acetyltransferase-like isoleucine patch superfamily enzyme